MKTSMLLFPALLALLLAGCSSPSSRIAANREAFATYPAEVQAKIRAGEVAVGFTPEQAKMALGKPDRVYTRTTDTGVSTIWVYRETSAGFGFGLGVAGYSGVSSSVGAGAGVETGSGGAVDDRLRVVFTAGRVTAIEKMTR
jgi:hypothetical protein